MHFFYILKLIKVKYQTHAVCRLKMWFQKVCVLLLLWRTAAVVGLDSQLLNIHGTWMKWIVQKEL